MTASPNPLLAAHYGTEDVFLEKTAGELPLIGRLSAALFAAGVGHHLAKSQAEQRDEAELMTQAAEELERQRLGPATSTLKHTRSPTFIGQGFLDPALIPVGMDEGMVRLAHATGRTLAKSAGIGTALAAGTGKALGGAAKSLGGWKGSLALGAGVIGAGVLGTKAFQGGMNAMKGETGSKNYGAGNYQMPFGVNEYGHPQVGTPLS